MRIAFTTSLPAEGLTRLEQHTLYAPLQEADVLVSTFDQPVTREMIMSAPNLKLVTNFGVGFNNGVYLFIGQTHALQKFAGKCQFYLPFLCPRFFAAIVI